jgi:hypothetical protein
MEIEHMAKNRRKWNQDIYEKYISEGRGQGEGEKYKPWIRVQDFGSRGTVSRIYSRKTNRIHHLLSKNEKYYFYLLEWSDNVMDIREQFPLSNVESAMNIAASAYIAYPIDSISRFPYVMTCDFMLTTLNGLKARTVKQVSELSNPRVLEKLEIERRYWDKHGVDWKIVTEHEIDVRKAQAIEWVRQQSDDFASNPALIMEFAQRFENSDSPLEVAKGIELDFRFPAGTGLSIFRHLIQTRQIRLKKSCKIGAINLGLLM